MIIYKNRDFIPHMQDVMDCDKGISELNDQWDNIKLLCEINCPIQSKSVLPNMANIQNSFYSLQQELIDALVSEKLNKMEQKIVFKAQVAIDILIRNLYERTADIGFLATDDDIRQFVTDDQRDDYNLAHIRSRLREYVRNYSVYEEIIILDHNNQVIANLDPSNPILNETINDPIIEKTLNSNDLYVESFAQSNLQPQRKKSHIFSSRIYDTNSQHTIGVICLCFRFEDEMNTIFEKLNADSDGSVMLIIDDHDRVIASSDQTHVPTGFKVEAVDPGIHGIQIHHGISYITKTVKSNGYQDYYGLGWRGHVMLPLNVACREKTDLEQIDEQTANNLLGMAESFSDQLNEIIEKTVTINSSLRRIVYNGQIIARDESLHEEYTRLKPILRAIGRIGTRTSNLFQTSVTDLFSTVVSSSLSESSFLASLCINIMDRNLYERANDCRWWALNSTFRTILAQEAISDGDKNQLTVVLAYINSLYTVYTNLFLFDKSGTIIAVSNPSRSGDIGKTLTAPFVNNILSNNQSERYFVSPFERTELYDNRPTYIYGASITDINHSNQTVGGIGIVFDSEFQFKQMLLESVDSEKTFAIFTDRRKTIIASTHPEYKTGSTLHLKDTLFNIENGQSTSELIPFENCYASIGCACSSGYREYKISDGYQNDVLAIVFDQLADCNSTISTSYKEMEIEQAEINYAMNEENIKLATFVINDQMFGLDQAVVLEALDTNQIVSMPGASGPIKGAVEYKGNFIAVVDLDILFNNSERNLDTSSLLVLQLSETETVALQVDKLNNVLEVNLNQIKPVGVSSSITGIFPLEDGTFRTILVMDHQVLLEKLIGHELAEDFLNNLPLLQQTNA
ncbi:chemotaxis protein CheW [Eubacteriaceae bacterium ES2]|nr:chemotaxis protein CheW [Eubacteriaceae bacterium ES2]